MEKTLLNSTIIMNLKERILQGDKEALQEFWDNTLSNGTPIIETIDGDSENALVTFVYKADEEIENIVLLPPIGRENLLENKMEKLLDTNLWYITYKVRNDVRFKYSLSVNDSFDDDDWTKRWEELIYDKLNKNILTFKGEDGKEDEIESYVVMPKAKEHFWVKERKGISKGKIYEYQLHSESLEKKRRIRVYTPYGYRQGNKPYKFLVLTDGDEYINVLSAVTVLDNLIAEGKIPPIITIFVDSPEETREDELSCNDIFSDIIIKDLIPWIRANYNISNKANEAIIGGLSSGGLTASYLGLKHSEVFGNVLSQSGSYWYKPETYEGSPLDCWLSTRFEAIDKLPLKFYLDVGVLEHKQGMIGTNIKLKDVLMSKGYTAHFEYFNSGHDYLSWGETLANGLISLIGIKSESTIYIEESSDVCD
jgi:enterochelin esterase-like enzyme